MSPRNVNRSGFEPDWPVPAGVRAWVTERGGGVSLGPYASLNVATHVGDAPGHVAKNRALVQKALQLPAVPTWLEQVHGSRVLDIDREPVATADGAVTARAGVVCAVMTADCLPVIFCNEATGRVGVAHAGWRGLLAGVLPAAVRAIAGKPVDVIAWLGPAIGPEAFEVGDEVRAAYLRASRASAAHFVANTRGRWQADLYGLARDSLAAAGVERVLGGGFCTYRESARFFSHRREAPCGRIATLIWRDP
jgi:purine-nucleoside/S-methyl-5'-thioadenosine phosphorylase / adenosine deaminase